MVAGAAQPVGSREATRLARLEALGKLWGEVRYRHPALASQPPRDWDAAFVSAVPAVESASDTGSYAAAVQRMLEALGDPATRVVQPWPEEPPPLPRPVVSWERDVLVLDLRVVSTPGGLNQVNASLESLPEQLGLARGLVVDLRARGLPESAASEMDSLVPLIVPLLVEGELRIPGTRSVMHSGYQSQRGLGSAYTTGFVTEAERVLTGSGVRVPGQVVFLLDERSVVGPHLLALRAARRALLVGEGPVTDAWAARTVEVVLTEGLRARVRTDEPVLPLTMDDSLPRRARLDGPDLALQQALTLAHRNFRHAGGPEPVSPRPPAVWRPDEKYATQPYPSRELRLLAAVRLWNVVQHFFGYTHLLEQPWSERLPELLTRLEAARDGREYALTVASIVAGLRDGHTLVYGHAAYRNLLTGTPLPVGCMVIDGQVVIVKLLDPNATPGLAVGDVIERVDGEPMSERLRRIDPYVGGSTPQGHNDNLGYIGLFGPRGSVATLTVRNASGVREVRVRRDFPAGTEEPGPAWRLLAGNVGYVDLTRLTPQEVVPALQALRETRGIVFDLRGYPLGTGPLLAPYLNVRGARESARLRVPVLQGNRLRGFADGAFPLSLDGAPWLYQGRVVTLIDERAYSQAESTAQFLRETANSLFVGSPTSGTNGDITDGTLPGGISFVFSGTDWRNADGSQLQRVGILPDIPVRPTVAGLQAGRDEVLERAVQALTR
jgi:C-terminal processing protease CtpA/Prc